MCTKEEEGVKRKYCHYADFTIFSIQEECINIDGTYYWVAIKQEQCRNCDEISGRCVEEGDLVVVCDLTTGRCQYTELNACDTMQDGERHRCVLKSDTFNARGRYEYDSVHEKCEEGTWAAKYDYCHPNGCNIKTGKCIGKIDTSELKCSDIQNQCKYDGYILKCPLGSEQVLSYSCGSGKCAKVSEGYYGGGYECVVPCSESERGKYSYSECASKDTEVAYLCIGNSYDKEVTNYLIASSRKCAKGCEYGKCIGGFSDEGRYCFDKYVPHCAASSVVKCDLKDNVVKAIDCLENDMVCVEDDNDAFCAKTCDELGKTYNDCNTIYAVHTSISYTCSQGHNGTYLKRNSEERCEFGCDKLTGKCMLKDD